MICANEQASKGLHFIAVCVLLLVFIFYSFDLLPLCEVTWCPRSFCNTRSTRRVTFVA
jgi:hypothetical protein